MPIFLRPFSGDRENTQVMGCGGWGKAINVDDLSDIRDIGKVTFLGWGDTEAWSRIIGVGRSTGGRLQS